MSSLGSYFIQARRPVFSLVLLMMATANALPNRTILINSAYDYLNCEVLYANAYSVISCKSS
jgi:hypothetical protein